jgi:putative flippase GtrA
MTVLRQFGRFGFVGMLSTATHITVGLGLHEAAGVGPQLANFTAFLCALGVSFLGQTRLTFPGAAMGRGAFARFTLVAVTGLGLNQIIVWLVTSVFAGPYWLALAFIIGTVPAGTFLMLKFWALRR